jgi:hypothetical protein
MIENVERLKKERPDLVGLFEKMDREQLLNQCYLECIDAINMERRVSLFMENCTNNMGYTTYTLESLTQLIADKQELDIRNWCADIVEDSDGDNNYIIERVLKELI